jgi:hypothetical protein
MRNENIEIAKETESNFDYTSYWEHELQSLENMALFFASHDLLKDEE